MSMRELFRQKLENNEIIPDTSVNAKLMRRLARREFVHFNPVRVNIYYLAGIVAAGIAATLFFSSTHGISNKSNLLNNSLEIRKTDIVENTIIPAEKTVNQQPDKSIINISESVKIRPGNGIKTGSDKVISQISESRENNIITQTTTDDSFSRNRLFSETSSQKNKLQGVIKTDKVFFETSATEGCIPLKIRFFNRSESFDSCRWIFGDGGYSSEKNPEWIFDVEGEYKIVLQLFSSDGLQTTSSAIITVHPKPQARFEIAPEKAVLPDDEIRFYNYSTDAVHFKWEFGDGNTSELFEPRHRYLRFGNFNVRLVASSAFGCSDSLTVINAFSGSEYFIEFPNAFIPNPEGPSGGYYSSKSDESALVFHPVFSGVSEYQLKIFSKLGILIFESNDVNIGWDGYFKGQQSEAGVYIWKVRGAFRNGETFTKMGDLTLLRN
jgi:hypothetical protein